MAIRNSGAVASCVRWARSRFFGRHQLAHGNTRGIGRSQFAADAGGEEAECSRLDRDRSTLDRAVEQKRVEPTPHPRSKCGSGSVGYACCVSPPQPQSRIVIRAVATPSLLDSAAPRPRVRARAPSERAPQTQIAHHRDDPLSSQHLNGSSISCDLGRAFHLLSFQGNRQSTNTSRAGPGRGSG